MQKGYMRVLFFNPDLKSQTGTFVNSEDQDVMLQNMAFHQIVYTWLTEKDLQRNNTIIFGNHNLYQYVQWPILTRLYQTLWKSALPWAKHNTQNDNRLIQYQH